MWADGQVPPPPPCKNALGCGLNGECHNGICECDKGWTGQVCGELDLMPVSKQEIGLFINGTTTWGGTPIVTTDPKTAKKVFSHAAANTACDWWVSSDRFACTHRPSTSSPSTWC